MKKIIAVMGATGAQGSGLVNAILGDPDKEFVARVITRNSESDAANALRARGAEVLAADIGDPGSIDKAFHGAYGAFCLTFFFNHFSASQELQEARTLARAARDAGLQHVVWSTLEDTRRWVPLSDDRMPTLQENFKVPHWDAKGEANEFFREFGVPTSFLRTSLYYDNFLREGMLQGETDGSVSISLPMSEKKMAIIAVEDIGKCAFGLLKHGKKWIGKTVGVAGEHMTIAEMAVALSQALGLPVQYKAISAEQFRNTGFAAGAEEFGNMFQFKRDFSEDVLAARDIDVSRALNPELQSFAAWLARNKDQIAIAT